MPRLTLIVAASLALTTLGGCASEVVSSARDSKATTSSAAPTSEPTTEPPAPPPANAARPVAPAAQKSAAPSTTTPTGTPTAVAPPAAADLTAVTDPKLGKLVTDQNGMTVYELETDSTAPPKSACLDDCAKLWPPVLLPASGSVRVVGVNSALLGKLTRPDRTIQLTLAGHPLYRFTGDATPGDTVGNGLAGTAFAISPTGGKPATPAAKG
jgi:predicted lipoprotein with Yx(FWY)xxD motif